MGSCELVQFHNHIPQQSVDFYTLTRFPSLLIWILVPVLACSSLASSSTLSLTLRWACWCVIEPFRGWSWRRSVGSHNLDRYPMRIHYFFGKDINGLYSCGRLRQVSASTIPFEANFRRCYYKFTFMKIIEVLVNEKYKISYAGMSFVAYFDSMRSFCCKNIWVDLWDGVWKFWSHRIYCRTISLEFITAHMVLEINKK